ncbi:MAG TPA: Dabb family protein [Acidimicrobiales bacterium]
MLRRFEVYAIDPDAPVERVRALEAACRRCGRFIPEVLDCAIGTNLSDAPVQLVWEHAYESPEAYRRYMVHPYHAVVVDRYLLPDSPERIAIDGPLGAGLYGYACDVASYRMRTGIRRLILLRLDAGTSEADVAELGETLERAPEVVPDMEVSVFAANTMGSAWFDGVTPVMGPPRWTHLWEQGFASFDALDAHRHSDTAVAEFERTDWGQATGGLVKRSAELFYEVSGDHGPEAAP